MGTNFYLFGKNKELVQKYAPYSYELTDMPDFGYTIHIAKTSCGWLPLFQAHKDGICSVAQYKEAYNTGAFKIIDEYGIEYTWDEFDERVLKFNGGIKGVAPREKINQDRNSPWFDKNMPEYKPVSHFEYACGRYNDEYFTDSDGYEFSIREFS